MPVKTYTIIVEDRDGKTHMRRTCDGFNPLELLGILSFTKEEIIKQIRGDLKYDTVKRNVIID